MDRDSDAAPSAAAPSAQLSPLTSLLPLLTSLVQLDNALLSRATSQALPHRTSHSSSSRFSDPPPCYPHFQFQVFYTSASSMHVCALAGGGRSGWVALPVKALKAGQESYWLGQIARKHEEDFFRRGWSPGRLIGRGRS